eukprot:372879_1
MATLIQSPNKNNKKNKHSKSQSLQNTELKTTLNDVKLPDLRSTNSAKPPKSKPLKIKRNNNNNNNNNNSNKSTTSLPMYRGHISVKHPKRYKRKTAAEMQFAVDDIQIPKGIKQQQQNDEEIEKQKDIKHIIISDVSGNNIHNITNENIDNNIINNNNNIINNINNNNNNNIEINNIELNNIEK